MYIGESIARREDDRFLMGRGNYVDDLDFPNATYAVFVRSPHAHARIGRVDTAQAERMPGILAVITGSDWAAAGLGKAPCISPVNFADGREMNTATRPVLVADKTCHVGDTVVAVIGESRWQAESGAEAVTVDYDVLPPVTDAAAALVGDAPVLHEALGTNLIFDVDHGDKAATAAAFDGADHIAEIELINNRISANPMETRCCIGLHDRAHDRYTLYTSNQAPHLLRNWLAEDTMSIPEHKLRVVAPDVGGGFGMKLAVYPEEAVVLWAAQMVGRPVRWVATRSEALVTDTHARDHITKCRMAFDAAGQILAVDVDTIANLGAYASVFGPGIPGVAHGRMMTGPYRTRAVYVRIRGAYTNTTPVEAYRGASRPEALYVLERLLDEGARGLGIDVCDIRSRNLIQPDQYPYATPTGMLYDSGNFPGLMVKLKELAGYESLREEQKRLRESGILMGIGVTSFTDYGGGAPNRVVAALIGRRLGSYEVGTVRVHPSGKVTALAGTHSHGQGHETTYCQIIADRLGCNIADVELAFGDTDRMPAGVGTWGSRSLVMAGMALTTAADTIFAKCKHLAAHLLECAETDIDVSDGRFAIRGTDRGLSFGEVSRAAYHGSSFPDGFEIGLDETVFYEPEAWVFSSSVHLAVVLVDAETGLVTLRDYVAVDDSGRVINPMIVEGQLHGAIAQGAGQALFETCTYDPESGQLLSGTFMDYGMPRATDLPTFRTGFQETLAPSNLLGAKGAGESGTLGAPPAIVNAVVDALAHVGVQHIDMPLTPSRIWQTLEAQTRSPQ